MPIGDVVAYGQQAYKPSAQPLSAYCGQSLSTDGRIVLSSVTRAVVVAVLYLGGMFGSTDPVQVLLHVVCHCEDDQPVRSVSL